MDEGAGWEGAVADYWVPRESTALCQPRLDGARLQHAVVPSEDTGCEYPASWVEKAAAVVDPVPGNGRRQTARLAQDPSRD